MWFPRERKEGNDGKKKEKGKKEKENSHRFEPKGPHYRQSPIRRGRDIVTFTQGWIRSFFSNHCCAFFFFFLIHVLVESPSTKGRTHSYFGTDAICNRVVARSLPSSVFPVTNMPYKTNAMNTSADRQKEIGRGIGHVMIINTVRETENWIRDPSVFPRQETPSMQAFAGSRPQSCGKVHVRWPARPQCCCLRRDYPVAVQVPSLLRLRAVCVRPAKCRSSRCRRTTSIG